MYGCKDRAPYRETVPMQDGMENVWLPHIVEEPFRMSRDCRYSASALGQADQQCQGCSWRATEEEK